MYQPLDNPASEPERRKKGPEALTEQELRKQLSFAAVLAHTFDTIEIAKKAATSEQSYLAEEDSVFRRVLGARFAELGPRIQATSGEVLERSANALLVDALSYGPALCRSGRCYVERFLEEFEGMTYSASLQQEAREYCERLLAAKNDQRLDELYSLEGLLNLGVVKSGDILKVMKSRMVETVKELPLFLADLMIYPGFDLAVQELRNDKEFVNAIVKGLRRGLQRGELDPCEIARPLADLGLGHVLSGERFLKATGEAIGICVEEGDLEYANHIVSLLPRNPENLAEFDPEALAVIAPHRMAAYKHLLTWLRHPQFRSVDVRSVQSTVENFLPDIKDDRDFAEAIADACIPLLEQSGRPHRVVWMMDLLSEELQSEIVNSPGIRERVTKRLADMRRVVNTKLRGAAYAAQNDSEEDFRKYAGEYSEVLRVRDWAQQLAKKFLIEIELEPVPERLRPVVAEERECFFQERWDPEWGRFLNPARVTVSLESWKKALKACKELASAGEFAKAAPRAEQLCGMINKVPALEFNPELAASAYQLRGVSCQDLDKRGAYLKQAARFALLVLGYEDASLSETFGALADHYTAMNLKDRSSIILLESLGDTISRMHEARDLQKLQEAMRARVELDQLYDAPHCGELFGFSSSSFRSLVLGRPALPAE